MQLGQNDIIVAQATPPGKGGVGIIRISGLSVKEIALKLLNKLPSPRYADYLPFLDENAEIIDLGLAIYFPSPHSFTGEDVLELHGHGGQVIMDILLKRVLDCGARLAEPGEFSYRAYMNDKMDLSQAEAIADLINSTTEVAARSAVRSLKGEFLQEISLLVEKLIKTRMHVESAIDFPEEEIDFLADEVLMQRITDVLNHIQQVFQKAKQGYVLNEGMSVVIAGQPNAGKSSLLNRLAGFDAAIVTDVAGTTRDVLKENIHIDGMPLHIIDTAGLRENVDVVEQEGIKRAWAEINNADHILLIIDDTKGYTDKDEAILSKLPAQLMVTIINNKIDVNNKLPKIESNENRTTISLSAKDDIGITILRTHLKSIMGYNGDTEGIFISRRRHLDALEEAKGQIETGYEQLKMHKAGELLAEDLRQAQIALNRITGEFDNEDLLGEIFSSFCIGK